MSSLPAIRSGCPAVIDVAYIVAQITQYSHGILHYSIVAGNNPVSFQHFRIMMQWLNEPEQWEIKDGALIMDITPQTDYWRNHTMDLP